MRDIALVCTADAIVGASFGAIAVSGGFEPWVPVVMSLIVFAGGAQFAALGIVLGGGGVVAAVATGLVLNARLLPFSFAVADVVRGRWYGAQLITDETVAFALKGRDARERHDYFWVSGLTLFAAWNVSVVVGALAGAVVGDTDALGLDAMFPAVLLALIVPALAERRVRVPVLAGGVVALAASAVLPAGVPVLLSLLGLLARPKEA
ncbi:AzlC family ABC transporter permease [Herbidospora daliensis]|uniref:AzlC family ABC transporter permease n=1 Tax=Herbidospora daliensis TaxID=295585 RepID=UPI001E65644D|nr:AzlC family ABC transporter permease [Herbidospora daliensis]